MVRSDGFTAAGAALIVIVIAALGFAGWTWWQTNQDAETQPVLEQNKNEEQKNNNKKEEKIIADIKTYLKKEGNAPEQYGYTVEEIKGDFAHASFGSMGGGAHIYLKRVDGAWNHVFSGQNTPPQCLGEYGFPADWYAATPTGYEDACTDPEQT